jgi:hypothetical protein
MWSLVCLIGLWGWIFASIGFILKAFPAKGEFHVKNAFLWGFVLIICYGTWFLGMLNA